MKYFFILGNNPTLSVAELAAVFGLDDNENANLRFGGLAAGGNICFLEMVEELDAAELIKTLGGTVKIGLIESGSGINTGEMLKKIIPRLKPGAAKFNFGLSFYGRRKLNLKPLAMEIKKYLRAQGVSCRWVVSREKTLSSVVVEQNGLVSGGAEIVLIEEKEKVLIGRTLAVQPFKELSYRDYGRPARDDRSGMLPPKLAQIMINLARAPKDGAILDPFCGSGTIMTEAMLMGYDNLIGTDISPKAILDTGNNIAWIKKNYKLQITNYKLFHLGVENLSDNIRPGSVDAVVTEPYLGPQRGRIDADKIKAELEKLYSAALGAFKKILKPGGRVVMIWPVFLRNNSNRCLSPDVNGFKIINPLPKYLHTDKNIRLTDRNTIVYGRPGQKVFREIVVLKN